MRRAGAWLLGAIVPIGCLLSEIDTVDSFGPGAGGGVVSTGTTGTDGGAGGGGGGSTSSAGASGGVNGTAGAGGSLGGSGGSTSGGGGSAGKGGSGGATNVGGSSGSGGATNVGGSIGAGGTAGAAGSGGSGGTSGSCGDRVKNVGEQCDGLDLAGKTCASIGLGGSGTLACNADCTLRTDGCKPTLVLFGGSPTGSFGQLLGDTWEYANGTWTPRSPMTKPSARYWAGLASYGATVLLFGGYGAATTGMAYLNDTWVWDGNNWTLKTPAHVPATRYSPCMGNLNGKVVMFGGWNTSALSDTWEWDGSDWTQRFPMSSPSGRDGTSMANLGGERLVLFGATTETWEWDGNNWALQSPMNPPPMRKYLESATLGGRVILFGGATGQTATSTHFADTWSWNGSSWSQLLASGPPGARRGFAMGPTGSGVLLFGGIGAGNVMYGDAWEYDGSTWVMRGAGPGMRMGVYLAAR